MSTKLVKIMSLLAVALLTNKATAIGPWDGCVNAYWPCNDGEIVIGWESTQVFDGDEEDPEITYDMQAVIYDHQLNPLSSAPLSGTSKRVCDDSTPNGGSAFTDGWDLVCGSDSNVIMMEQSVGSATDVYTGCYAYPSDGPSHPYCPNSGVNSQAFGWVACCGDKITISK